MLLIALTSLIAEARQTVANATVNPAAVQFKDVRQSGIAVCGQINKPNRLGGYDGFRPFVYYSKTRWSIGTSDGLVMEDGRLIDKDALNARHDQRRHRSLPDSDDVDYWAVYSASLRQSVKQLGACAP